MTTLPLAIAERVLSEARSRPRRSAARTDARLRRIRPRRPTRLKELMDELRQRLAIKAGPARVVEAAAAKPTPAPAPTKAAEVPAPVAIEKSAEPANAPNEPEPTNDREVLAQLRRWDHSELAGALSGEPPGVVAVVMNCLDGGSAGKVFKLIPVDETKDAFISLVGCNANDHLAVQIVRTILRKCKAGRQRAADKIGPQSDEERYKQLAGLLRLRSHRKPRTELLEALAQFDGDAAAAVKDQLYTFEDLLLLDDRSVQKVLRRVNAEVLNVRTDRRDGRNQGRGAAQFEQAGQ